MSDGQDTGRSPLLPLVLLLAAIGAVYVNSLGGPFHFDDEHSITANPAVRSLEHVGRFFTDTQTFSRNQGSAMFRPLVVLSYAVNHAVGGYSPLGYHALNLALHLAAAGLLYALLRQLGAAAATAAIGAALFGLNPLTTEPVNYISSRSESMALAFTLASLVLYMRGRESRWPAAASIVCFALALLSKSVSVVLPGLLAAHELVVERRSLRLWWRRHLPYWVLTAAYVAVTRQLLAEALAGDTAVRSWTAQAASQTVALVHYMKLLAFPWPLSVEAPLGEAGGLGDVEVLACVGLCLSAAWAMWRWARHTDRRAEYGLFWAALVLLPTAVVPLNVIAAERRLYPVLVGAVAFLVWGVMRHAVVRKPAIAVLLLVYGGLTIQRNQVWATERDLWEDAARRAPAAVRPHLRLGVLLRHEGDLEGAERELQRALHLDARSAPAWNNLGNVKAARGELDVAIDHYQRALDLLPSYPEALANLGSLYSRLGRHGEAAALLERALPLSGRRPEMLANLGTAYLRAGDYPRAEAVLREALASGHRSSSLLQGLGGALEGQGDAAGALTQYRRAATANPTDAKPYLRMAALLESMDRPLEAAAAYRSFLAYWDGETQVAAAARARLEAIEVGR